MYEIKYSVNLLEMEEIRDFIRNSSAPRVGFRWVLDLTRDDDYFTWVAVPENRINSRQMTPLQEITENQMNQGQFITERASAAVRRLTRRRPRRDSDEDIGKENKNPRNNPDNDGNGNASGSTAEPLLNGLGRTAVNFAYCMRCRCKTKMKRAKHMKSENGKNMLKGVCSKCKTTTCKFI